MNELKWQMRRINQWNHESMRLLTNGKYSKEFDNLKNLSRLFYVVVSSFDLLVERDWQELKNFR